MSLLLNQKPQSSSSKCGRFRRGRSPHQTRPRRGYVREQETQTKCPRPGSERTIARLLEKAGIDYLYEPTEFELRGKQGFVPDFFLPDYGLYLEVTVGERAIMREKRSKIGATGTLYGVVVLLIGSHELEDFISGRIRILDFITANQPQEELLIASQAA